MTEMWWGDEPLPEHARALAEPVSVQTLASLRVRKTRPLDRTLDDQTPVVIAYDPQSGRGNLADGNHRVSEALIRRVATLPAVVQIAPTTVLDHDPVVGSRNPTLGREPRFLRPSEIGLRSEATRKTRCYEACTEGVVGS